MIPAGVTADPSGDPAPAAPPASTPCDIKPVTPVASLDRRPEDDDSGRYDLADVAPVVGMSPTFIRRVLGPRERLSRADVIGLLDQDAFAETLTPRSRVLAYLDRSAQQRQLPPEPVQTARFELRQGHAIDLLRELPSRSVHCVVTSTPYWGLRLYREPYLATWADGEICSYGHEQTPEGFLRHTTEVLLEIKRVLVDAGSIWWNVMDTFNTRTQIRRNAAEALNAMQGNDLRGWGDHEARRYSAGHSYLLDGEQALIPSRIAERASRAGLYAKTVITWAKTATLPEPQRSRVSRNLEYILHLTKVRTPHFNKAAYFSTAPALGGRNPDLETRKLSDVWVLPTSAGTGGHGAQFPVSLPGRCIAISTEVDDLVLDPFSGTANSGVAALSLGRRFLGFDGSQDYLATAKERLAAVDPALPSDPPETQDRTQ